MLTMIKIRLMSTMLAIFLNLLLVNWDINYCSASLAGAPDISSKLAPIASSSTLEPEPVPLDFVYHNYAMVTEFLHYCLFHVWICKNWIILYQVIRIITDLENYSINILKQDSEIRETLLNAFLYYSTIHQSYPDLTHLYSIGETIQGRKLWVLIVAAAPTFHIQGRPNVRLDAAIHGNEAISVEMILHFIKYLLENYHNDPAIKEFMSNTRTHLFPLMNPDGLEQAQPNKKFSYQGRDNANKVDLNRDYNNLDKQPETIAMLDWMKLYPFILGATLHSGAVVVNYPRDHPPPNSVNPLTRDNDVCEHLARTFAINNPHMKDGTTYRSRVFPEGIVNGADFLKAKGTKGDCLYDLGCIELTVEMSEWKYPEAEKIEGFFEANRTSMLKFLNEVHRGVKGLVKDKTSSSAIHEATLKIKERINFKTTVHGEFWRILLPGRYTLEVNAAGYISHSVEFEVVADRVTELTVLLEKKMSK